MMFRQAILRTSRYATPRSRNLHSIAVHSRQLLQCRPGLVTLHARPSLRPEVGRVAPLLAVKAFHATPRREGGPLIPFFAAMLKASTSLEFVRMLGRVVLTFLPVIWIANAKSSRWLKYAEMKGIETSEERKAKMLKQIRTRKYILWGMLLVPVTLFWATIVASLEKTPLTGRWRMIILSPEEEEEIARQLAGSGWYQAVGDILAQDGHFTIIPPDDWRYQWVNETLRRLEGSIPILTNEPKIHSSWSQNPDDAFPMPPPAEYPLRPRPRATAYLRMFCEHFCPTTKEANEKANGHPVAVSPHVIPGPPYSLLLIDKPDASNAFSYGFGPDGGGGIVVYSGFLDDVLSRAPPHLLPQPEPAKKDQSWLGWLFGGLFSSRPPPPKTLGPTPEQTSELAILLAHELAHLVLSHHLESLSSSTVIIPGTLSLITDLVRVGLFPITMLFGPFVNDALAQLGKTGSLELTRVGEYCTSVAQEVEADVVSMRLLAHAGFDARHAVKFWEDRSNMSECSSPTSSEFEATRASDSLVRRIMGTSHPVNEIRVERLRTELEQWDAARRSILARLEDPSTV